MAYYCFKYFNNGFVYKYIQRIMHFIRYIHSGFYWGLKFSKVKVVLDIVLFFNSTI